MRWVWLVVAGLAVVAPGARADGNRDEAKAHNDLARVLFEQGKYAEAESEYQKAFVLAPLADLLFNIGLCQEKRQRPGDAAATYERFLAVETHYEGTAELRRRINRLKAQAAAARPVAPVAPVAAVAAEPPEEPSTPIYRRFWFWSGLAAVVLIGAAIGLGVALANPQTTSYPAVSF
jgi:tetratricopeptide (TPR) repeat protein